MLKDVFMQSNIERYKTDFKRLQKDAVLLEHSFIYRLEGEKFRKGMIKAFDGDEAEVDKHLNSLPSFGATYQSWYSECVVLLKQLLPDRLADFVRHYEKPKNRKTITFESYRIEDALLGLQVTRPGGQVVVDESAALGHFRQQVAILDSLGSRFDSLLYDIRQFVQADLLDSEIDAAKELLKHKFTRAAGAVAGVVLEKHLQEVCTRREIKISKKYPTITDLNEALKNSGIIDTPQWRFNQHLADIRNLCDHNKKVEPSTEQVQDLIDGVSKVIKTLF